MLRDTLYALRLVRRSPAYALVVITVLAVGIAANVIAFSLLKAVALAPLAGVAQSGSLQFVGARPVSGQVIPLSYPDYVDIRDRAFPALAAWGLQPLILAHHGNLSLAQTELVTGNYFEVLGVRAQVGRRIEPADARRPGQPVAVLSDGLWRRAFGADPAVVGSTIRVNHQPLTVIGVADRSFRGGIVGLATDLFVPMTLTDMLTGNRALDDRGDRWVHGFMRPGTLSRGARDARAAQISAALLSEHPDDRLQARAAVVPLWQWPYGAQGLMLPASALMSAMAALLLVVVSANVAGLVLARTLARRAETAARFTLGATRGQIMRQLIIESLVLALPAAALGFLIPGLLQPFLSAAAANIAIPLFFNTDPDRSVVAFVVLLAAGSAVIHGVIPAIRLSRVDMSVVLKDGLASGGSRAGRLRTGLVVAQIAVALVLLVGTALILRTMEAAQHADAGFDSRHVTWAGFDARAGGYDEPRGRVMYDRLLQSVRRDPGVTEASLAAFLPLSLIDWMNWNVSIDGYQPRRDELLGFAVNIVSSGYFRTLGIPLVAGRAFEERDAEASTPPVVVNETFARRFWGSPAAAIGRGIETQGRHATVIGVARDIKYARLDESPRPYLYVPASHFYSASLILQVHGTDRAGALGRIREEAAAIDPAMTILQSGAMADTLRSATSLYETLARMLTLVGVLAVLVAALGVYGLLAYTVRQRAHEIGVRTALGATRASIVGAFLRDGARLAAIGAAIGIVAALGVGRMMTTLLFGVAGTDPASFAMATAVVTGSALLACALPAWRAATADPLAALRHR